MAAEHKIIYVWQEIAPYLAVSDNAKLGRALPQAMQQKKYEVRVFMPDFGEINERRNQLHEVIRLSGMSIVIGDSDHPLVVKVASMQPSRIQVYFIDNDDYFVKEDGDADAFGTNRADNDERAIFFARGMMDTAKKLRWEPEVLSVSGWMNGLVPLYLKRVYNDGPSFRSTRVVTHLLPGATPASVSEEIFDKLKVEGVKPADIKKLRELPLDADFFTKASILFSDAVVIQGCEPSEAVAEFIKAREISVLTLADMETHGDEADAFYKSLMGKK